MEQVTHDDLRELAARLFALQAALIAVIETHPEAQALDAALSAAEDAGLANMLYLWPEEHLQVYRTTVQILRDRIPPR